MNPSNWWIIGVLVAQGVFGPHDIRTDLTQDYCGVCHTSHGAKAGFLLSLSPRGEIQTSSPDAVLDSVSLFCLACHSDGGNIGQKMRSDRLLGLSLTDDHPIGIPYALRVRARPDYTPPLHLPESVPLKKGRIGCTTCHDPHSKKEGPMLRDARPNLCRNCHLLRIQDAHTFLTCTDCHQMHSAWQTSLLKPNLATTCSECHTFLPESHARNPWECESCHNPHRKTGTKHFPPIKKMP